MNESTSAAIVILLALVSAPFCAEASPQEPSVASREQRQNFRVARGMQAMLQNTHRQLQARGTLPDKGLKSLLIQLESFSETTGDGATIMVIIVVLFAFIVAGVMYMVFSGDTDRESYRKKTMATDDPFLVNSYPGTPGSANLHRSPHTRTLSPSPIGEAGGKTRMANSLWHGPTLCPSLVVSEPKGMIYKFNGTIQPREQQETFQIVDQNGSAAMLLYIFEEGRDCGILLENSARLPVAFVDTSTAQLVKGSPSGQPHVSIRRASPIVGGGGSQDAFGVVSRREANVFTVSQGRLGGPVMLTVRIAGEKSEIIDSSQQVCASCESHWGKAVVRVEQGNDAGLILCAMAATMKLGGHS